MIHHDQVGILLFEDGTIMVGQGMGPQKIAIGELCFNTAMTGYQEIITDPSYAQQIINFTFPQIGIVGTNDHDYESPQAYATGCIFAVTPSVSSNWRANSRLNDWLNKQGLVAISGLDTRYLTQKIRQQKPMRILLANLPKQAIDKQTLLTQLKNFPDIDKTDLALQVSCKKPYEWREGSGIWTENNNTFNFKPYHVVAVDYGIKRNILRLLVDSGCYVTVVPCQTTADDIMSYNPDGVFLSNGPGNPAITASYTNPMLQKLFSKSIPIFGICLGHQLLALAINAQTRKMPAGHRGANHPVQNLLTGKVEITSQNHGFEVVESTLPSTVRVTHRSLFDKTVEGMQFTNKPVFSVQYHPEASPGTHDSRYLFGQFITYMQQYRIHQSR